MQGGAVEADRLATMMSGRAAKDTLAAACALGRTKERRGLIRRLTDSTSCLEHCRWANDCMLSYPLRKVLVHMPAMVRWVGRGRWSVARRRRVRLSMSRVSHKKKAHQP